VRRGGGSSTAARVSISARVGALHRSGYQDQGPSPSPCLAREHHLVFFIFGCTLLCLYVAMDTNAQDVQHESPLDEPPRQAPPERGVQPLLHCHLCNFATRAMEGLKWHLMRSHQSLQRHTEQRTATYERSRARLRSTLWRRRRSVQSGGGLAERGPGDDGGASDHPSDGHPPSDAHNFGDGGGPAVPPASSGAGPATPAPDYHARLERDFRAVLEHSTRLRKRQRGNDAGPNAPPEQQEYEFNCVNAEIRADYEELRNAQRAVIMTMPKNNKRSKRGKFNTKRLRALEKYVLSAGGPGMSVQGLKKFWKFMHEWEKPPNNRKPCNKMLSETFKSGTAFASSVAADLDGAMEDARWMQCEFVEGGINYEAYYLPFVDVMMQMVADATNIQFWSGADGPAEPTERRETPMDGDIFRLFEKDVHSKGRGNFVLGFHAFSDSHVLSGSGGKCSGASCFFWCGRFGDRWVMEVACFRTLTIENRFAFSLFLF